MSAPGPVDPTRSSNAAALLPAARGAAAAADVTRLADLTRLDRLGLPVWQAVRPMSRALSVHQGKGATDADAQLGALLEAVESHRSEIFDDDGPRCRFDALPIDERAALFADFARDRAAPPPADRPCRWVAAADPVSGRPLHLPFEIVSMDLTRDLPSRFDRSSNGVAAGATHDEAIAVALHEIVERDAMIEWQSHGIVACTASALRLDTIPFDWLGSWRERLDRAGIAMRCYHVPSIAGSPVIACELNDPARAAAPYRATHGRGCHPIPEIALFKAIAEALQARATYIAGAREDIPTSAYAPRPGAIVIAFGLPLPARMAGIDWGAVEPGPIGHEALIEALARAGYPQVAIVDLGAPQGLAVVRAFVCGLGSIDRRRRPSLP